MASFTAIRAGLAANIATLPGWAVYTPPAEGDPEPTGMLAYAINPSPDTLVAPAAVVGGFRRVQFGQSLGGPGKLSEWEIPIRVFVGDASEPASQSELDAFIATDGEQSIILAIMSDPKLGGAARGVQVREAARYGVVPVGDFSYLAFELIVVVQA